MAQFLAIVTFLETVAPLLGKLYDIVKASMPADSPGAAKLEAFKGLLMQAVAVEQTLAPVAQQAWPFVAALVTAIHGAKVGAPVLASDGPQPAH